MSKIHTFSCSQEYMFDYYSNNKTQAYRISFLRLFKGLSENSEMRSASKLLGVGTFVAFRGPFHFVMN